MASLLFFSKVWLTLEGEKLINNAIFGRQVAKSGLPFVPEQDVAETRKRKNLNNNIFG